MPQGITTEEATELRAIIAEALKDEPRRSPKRAALRKAFGESNFSSFMEGKRGASPKGRARVLVVLDGGTVPKRRPGVGRAWKHVTPEESKAIRAEVMRQVESKYETLGNFLKTAMGLESKSQSHMYKVIMHGGGLTVETAAKLRAALAGRPVAPPRPRAGAKPGPKPGAKAALVLATPRTKAPRAPRNVLASLRLDAGHVLAARFGGSVPALARELGTTAHRLSKFLDGGPLTLDESAEVANRLSPLARIESVSPAPGLTMVRAVANGISAEAWSNGSGHAGPPINGAPALAARKLVEGWSQDALRFVLQLAQGGGALT